MELDSYTVSLLVLREDAPELDEATADALQDAHLAFLADLHEQGHLVAAGPLSHERFRGLSILRGDVETVRALKQRDPLVRAGRMDVAVMAWQLPAGAVAFSPTSFPRSVADVLGG